MMNLEQRMAEITSRSEEIFRKRRQRKGILLACMPLVLCVGILASLPLLPGIGVDDPAPDPEMWTRPAVEEETQTVSVLIGGKGFEITDQVRVQEICDAINDLMRNSEAASGDTEIGGDLSVPGQDESNGDHIIITFANGSTKSYCLWSDRLTDQESGQAFRITKDDAAQLKALLYQ